MVHLPIQLKILLPVDNLKPLDYLLEAGQKVVPGSFVVVPFRRKQMIGVIWSDEKDLTLDVNKLKNIHEVLNIPALPPSMLAFIKSVSGYNIVSPSSILKLVIPTIILPKNIVKLIEEAKSKTNWDGKVANQIDYLSETQKVAAEKLKDTVKLNKYNVTLLDGVTGSGKTEVYLAAISEVLKNKNGQALILLPEIILTSQLIKRFSDKLGVKPGQWHSDLSVAKKKRLWLDVTQGKERLVVGARSALFLPFKKLSLIIIDEEHESSFKQEEGVLYNARDMAILRAYKENIPIILVSATPSLETMLNCQQQKYDHIELPTRFNNDFLPYIEVVDMRIESLNKNSWISDRLKTAILENYQHKYQTILFLNRRGYAPLTLCRKCGFRFSCPSCSTWLVEHRVGQVLQCHHCSYTINYPEQCPKCREKESFIACGPGVERIEEEVKSFLPDARIAILTKDTTEKLSDTAEIIQKILDNQVDIIIGTQLIAKGHHFPMITLVGIVDADLGLLGSDLRATERSYQLLHQVGGRAGREALAGKVMIQTYNPENPIVRALMDNKRSEFIKNELQARKHSMMPPFGKLCAVIISGKNEDRVRSFSKNMAKVAPENLDITILGPVPALFTKLRGKYRYRILVKASKNVNIQKYINYWLSLLKKDDSIKVKIDVDPYSFF